MSGTEVTLKNTKAEILEALNSALKRSEILEKIKLNTEKVEKEQFEKKAVQRHVEENIFSTELNVSNELIVMLQNKLDKSYTELCELAARTVKFTGGVKNLGNLEGKWLYQLR